jgi:hypothetical protein
MHKLDPRANHWVRNENIYSWRLYLKRELLRQRGYVSDYSGKPFTGACEMHEGIITRANVPKNIHWHFYIYHPFNCVLLLPEEHRPKPPPREWCIQWAYEKYGREDVKAWYESLPFKARPFRLL